MKKWLNRREFLKLCAASVGSIALSPNLIHLSYFDSGNLVRVGTESVSVYKEPDDESPIICQRYKDEILNVYYEVVSDKGPSYNPLWYRVWQGYIHSAYLENVKYCLNPVLDTVPEEGKLVEVTVPYTQTFLNDRYKGWDASSYRLYYGSLHWAMAVEEGPDGEAWYRIKDELLKISYYAPAIHFRPVEAAEVTPISPDVPAYTKRIEISIADQTLIAYEGDKVVLNTVVSTGIPNPRLSKDSVPTSTPKGTYNIFSKMPSKHMGNGTLTNDINAYELPGVPWVSFFAEHGVAIHGTYWHNNFGIQMSHGCVNMRTEEALWIYRWTTPEAGIDSWEKRGKGTKVVVS